MAAPLEFALGYAAKGWRVLPLHSPTQGGCTCGKADCTSVAKHPRTAHGVKDATTDAEQIRRWWSEWPTANVGIATGRESGLVVLDVDADKGGELSLETLCANGNALPNTVETITGGGGRHIWFSHPGGVIRNAVELQKHSGLDIRADGGYIVVPPSVHASGRTYEFEASSHPRTVALAPLPSWLLAMLTTDRLAQAAERLGDPDEIPAGKRNDTLTRIAGALRNEGLGADALLAALGAENARRCNPPLAKEELAKIAQSVARYEPKDSEIHLTDTGNALRLIAAHGEDLRYVPLWGKWVVWDGKRWCIDNCQEVERRAKQTVIALYRQASEIVEKEERRALARWALSSESASRRRAMLEVAEAEVTAVPELFDQDPYALTVENGVIDLRTGNLRPARREDYSTKLVPVAYDPKAKCPQWEGFLDRILGGSDELYTFLRKAVGYSLTADTSEDCLFILHGTGSNGKSTLLDTLGALLGDYGMSTPPETLLLKHYEGIPNDLARLRGARFVSAVETDEGRRLAESRIKAMTGGDTMTARFLRAEWFDFKAEFKLWLATNHKPEIRGTDHAIWRRIRLIPFDVRIPEKEQDRHLPEKLREELPGILAWAVEGATAWGISGLSAPELVVKATASYREEEDTFAAFLADCCILQTGTTIKASVLHKAYTVWADENGEKAQSQRRVFAALHERGLDRTRGKHGFFYHGVALSGEGSEGSEGSGEG